MCGEISATMEKNVSKSKCAGKFKGASNQQRFVNWIYTIYL